MIVHLIHIKDQLKRVVLKVSWETRRELLIFFVLGSLGAAASYLNVRIPHTDLFIEVRWAFGFMAFALLRHIWSCIILASILSVMTPAGLPLTICLMGNMLYVLPSMAVIRAFQKYILNRTENIVLYGVGWFFLLFACYQIFITPVIWAVLAMLDNKPVWPFVFSGLTKQPYLVESLLSGIIVASGMVVFRSLTHLRHSRHELEIMLDAINDGVIATDSRGRVIRMNPAATKLTGWSIKDARGKPLKQIFHIIHAHTRLTAPNPVDRVLSKGVVEELSEHTCLISRDGSEYHIADSAAPIKEPDGSIIGSIMVFRDVTAEYAVQKTLQRVNDLVERSPAVLFIWKNDEGFLPVQWASPNTEQIFGYSSQDFMNRAIDYADIIHPEDLHRVQKELTRFSNDTRNSQFVHEPYRIIRKDGDVRWIEDRTTIRRSDRGIIISYEGILIDITERKSVEDQLRFHSRILEQIQDLITVTDMQGHITYINHAVESLLGMSLNELAGMHVSLFGEDPKSGISQVEIIEKTLSNGHWRGEITNYGKDGSAVILDCRTHIIHDLKGNPSAMCGISTDITEKKHLQEERQQIEKQYRQIQKIESIGRLAGGVAHDLNNLLTPILGYSEMILDDFAEGDRRRSSVEEIVKAAIRSRNLVRQLLAFSRKQMLDFKPLDLNSVLSGFEKLLRRTIREDIKIRVSMEKELPTLLADVGQLEQVIMNLAVNAQDAMPDGGELTITTALAKPDRSCAEKKHGIIPGSYIMLSVSDTGCGMDAEILEHMFEPFFTTKSVNKGTGLGLATVYGIVKQHGGNISVYSEPGLGTTFKVYLPVSGKKADDSERMNSIQQDHKGSETILLAEDNDQVRELTRDMLERQGYDTIAARDGKEALKIIDRLNRPVHLLLTDLVMPEMSGRELFRLTADRFSNLKVLYMSGYADDIIAHHGALDNGVDFIQKPFSLNDLLSKVRDVLKKG